MNEPSPSALHAIRHPWRTRIERLRRPLLVIAAIGTVLGGLAGYINLYRAVKAPIPPVAPSTVPSFVAPVSLLVLPLANLTGDPGRAYVADGLTAALVADLGRIDGAAIVPAAVAFTMQRDNLTLQDLASKARVRFVLQGTVQASGEVLRITAQLYDTVRAATLWSKSFDGSLERLFELQDAVTTQVRAAVSPTMTLAAAEDAMRRPESRNVADLLLRYEALGMQAVSLAPLREMERLARAALAAEPDNMRAMAALATVLYSISWDFFDEVGDAALVGRHFREAVLLARKVNQRDPQNVQMFTVVAADAFVRRDWTALRAWADRLAGAKRYNSAAIYYRDLGLLDEAMQQLQIQLSLPEFRPDLGLRQTLAMVSMYRDRPDDALSWLQQAETISAEYALIPCFRAQALGMKADEPGARAAGAECLKRLPHFKGQFGGLLAKGRLWPLMEPAARQALAQRLIAAELLAGLPQL